MNNKSDKKHKPKPKTKKKTASLRSKKKKVGGGLFSSIRTAFSRNNPKSNTTTQSTESLLEPLVNSRNLPQNAQPQPLVNSNKLLPNAQPQGFNTLKAQSRCSIL